MVAVGMNGEPLPTRHGYPARLIVPGLFGYVSATKWLSEIELTRFEDFEGYWIPRGWNREAPVTTASRFDTPSDGAEVRAGTPVGLGGVAWAMIRGVESVEVRVDEGDWEEAELGEEYSTTTWRQWRHSVELTPGEHSLAVRATDTDGVTQSGERALPGPGAASGWHTIRLSAS
ncbi:MAG: molybdopterin-dependent oxidoreductase [Microthrixaceae bacterium]